MVYLNRIYTKTGDDGTTGLGDGSRVPKTHPRIVAYGGIDELNSVLGLVLCQPLPDPLPEWLARIQNDLFDVGADLCVPLTAAETDLLDGITPSAEDPDDADAVAEPAQPPLRLIASQVEQLEQWIDEVNTHLQPLHSFILPGGSPASAYLHLARTVCRRVEVQVLNLAEFEVINPQTHIYLNRLSDLLFVLARYNNGLGQKDVLWVPGQNR